MQLILALLVSLGTLAMAVPTEGCTGSSAWSGCTISNSGSSVEIGATRPGGGSSGGGRENASAPESGPRAPGGPAAPVPPGPDCIADPRDPRCYSIVVLRPTLADVASFAPAASLLADEPDGVGIVGMPMNFVVSATPHTATGTLFDLPVTVRFVPASFVFVHGDGTSRTSATGGQSWAALGQAQFSATATSHAYAARGTYGAAAIVQYAATVDFGSGDVSVPGLLEVRTPTSTIEVVEVRTALVDRTCLESPGGPGC
ncbi:hypothetical protein [uncultured Microbacterium sp.]|uniref:hypothetical protein n=1 Tax=uncultured Microbacterium sp. TaxID=191216 RepID=UPI002619FAA9|nr:hypothetical protein [uncultured Microbacterium sp.]